jgi:hypothetical protein
MWTLTPQPAGLWRAARQPKEEIEMGFLSKLLRRTRTEKMAGRDDAESQAPASQIDITGDWTTLFWDRRPVRVYAELDAAATFLSQEALPYLWPDVTEYRESVDSKGDPQRSLRLAWTVAYLHHPDPRVIRRVLRDHIRAETRETVGMIDSLADLLAHPDDEVRAEAAKVIWTCGDPSLESVFTILGSQGMIPSGISPQHARRAVQTLRAHCPPERRDLFERLAVEAFGPGWGHRDASQTHLREGADAAEPRGFIREETRDPEVATRIAFEEALPMTEELSVDAVERRIRDFTERPNQWGATHLYRGPCDGIRDLVLHNLVRISKEAGFRRFEISLTESRDGVRIAGWFSGFWVPVHIERAEEECFVAGNADFAHSPEIVLNRRIEGIETRYRERQRRDREAIRASGMRLLCRHCGSSWGVDDCRDVEIHEGEYIVFWCPRCGIPDMTKLE